MAARRLYPTAAEQVRERLAIHKIAGAPFDVAWERALYSLEHVRGADSRAWRTALEATRDEWRAAYLDEPTPLAPLASLDVDELIAGARAMGENAADADDAAAAPLAA